MDVLMSRPQISSDLMQVVQEIHQEQTGSSAGSFEEALETVVQLASQQASDEGWYPGKFAGMALDRVLGDDQATPVTQRRPPRSSPPHSVIDPDQQAVFKQTLDEDYTVTLPEAERAAFGLSSGEILQVIAYPAVNNNDE